MNWDIILTMLGTGGIFSLFNYLINLKAKRKKSVLDKDDISRLMAERDNELILKQFYEKRDILEKLSALEEMLYQLVRCKHYYDCPARYKLQEYKANLQHQRNRQPDLESKGFRYPRDNPVESGGVDCPDGQPP
ncbi:hypothetical protein DW083_06130 [Parabacteroides sp. AF48-14]|uniref:hypothetical protein n=1 Tax=Parabacteroides sp. AF48-14 TaxID=2292052 RepID=UPI000EFEAD5F|nr:hypothetical protein [Parabacteroides sp. AF48-14]RHO73422.1 hypothetical protein DW083_06130 [Parabacteroides sp. AF48-14]